VRQNKLIAVVQPHRYSRLADLFVDFCGCFHDADEVLVADVYAAGETPIDGIDRDALVSGLRDHGHKAASALLHRDDLASEIKARTSGGDLVMCLGAGDITNWAANLPDELENWETQNDRPVVPFTHRCAAPISQPPSWHNIHGLAWAARQTSYFARCDENDLATFLAGCPADIPVNRDGRRVESFGA
jgi:hypothetical protein